MISTKTQVFHHFYMVVYSLSALFYEGSVAFENGQNLRTWSILENEEEETLYVSMLYVDNASQFHIISSYNILSLP